jgi:hypothetical protein
VVGVSPDERQGLRVERSTWPVEERRRITLALSEARFWTYVEPHKTEFWALFESKLTAGYPEARFDWEEQPGLEAWS